MSTGIEIKGLKEVAEYVDSFPEEFFEPVKEIFKERTFAAHRETTGNLTGSPMRSRTGLLRKSIKTEVSGTTLDNLRAGVFSSRFVSGGNEVVYAPIHEYGGVVVAKNAYKNVPGGPYLNIPLQANQTPAGVMRYSPKEVFKHMGGYIAGRAVMVGTTPMFALVRQVKIPAQLGMTKAVEDEVPTLLSQIRNVKV